MYGTIKETEMWRKCVSFVNNNMDEAVGRLYVEQAFSEKSKEMVSWGALLVFIFIIIQSLDISHDNLSGDQ